MNIPTNPPATMSQVPKKIRKEIPEAVLRKVEQMDEITQLGFADDFKRRKKSMNVGFLLLLIGCHYFYFGRIGANLLFWLTMGGLGVWVLVDLFRINHMIREWNRSLAIDVLRDIQVLQ